ncbi:MAG: TldD/PmbA family protein [Acidimicrobiia bacterium]|nr:TldD/PmbA family protein [Acidimicrobiia bacterium]
MNDRQFCSRVIERVAGRAEAQVAVVRGPSGLTRFANSFIHQNVAEDQAAVSLTVSIGGRVATFTSNRTGGDAIDDLIDRSLAAAALRPVDPLWPGMAPAAGVAAVDHYDAPTADAEPATRAAIVRDFIDAGGGLSGAGFCETEGTTVTFANTEGQRCEGSATRAILDGIHQTPLSAGKAHQTANIVAALDGIDAGRMAAEKARSSVDAIDLKPGRYEVVLEPDAVATILIFLAVYGFNARAAIEQRSFVELGSLQFDQTITLIDDPTRDDALGVAFDAEGTPKGATTLIEAGTARSLTHNRRTAGQMDAVSTGHAVSGGGGFGAFATNMFLEPGDASLDAMVASVDRGLLVTEFNYCRVLDPRTLAVTGLTRNGTFLVENGEIAGPVSNLRFTQSFASALGPGAVLSVEDAARFANSDFGPGFAHVPSVRLAEWNFTGGVQA